MTPLERAEAAVGPLFMEDLPDLSAIVRAVVAAIREPSVEQVKAGWTEVAEGSDPAQLYAAMIDVLLDAG